MLCSSVYLRALSNALFNQYYVAYDDVITSQTELNTSSSQQHEATSTAMSTFTDEQVDALKDNHPKLFDKVKEELNQKHGVSFRGKPKTGQEGIKRYVAAFNQYAKTVKKALGKPIDEVLQSAKKKKPKVITDYIS